MNTQMRVRVAERVSVTLEKLLKSPLAKPGVCGGGRAQVGLLSATDLEQVPSPSELQLHGPQDREMMTVSQRSP